jgi:hypothetical protein
MGGFSLIIKDLLYACGTVLILTNTDWRSFRSILFSILKIVAIWIGLIFLSSVFYMFFGNTNRLPLTYAAIVLLYAIFFSRLRLTSKITLSTCYYMFFVYAIHSVDILYSLWTGSETFNPIGPWNSFFEGIRCLLIFIVFVFVLTYLKVCATEEYEYVNHAGVVVLVAFLVVMLILPDYAEKGNNFQNFIANTLLWLLQLLTYYMFYAATREHNERLETQMINAHRASEIEQMHAAYKNHEDILMLRHEIKNQYAYMKNMLVEKQYDKLDQFFSGFENRVLKSLEFIDCGNFTVNSVLNIEQSKAKYYGFSIEQKIAVPSKLPIEDADLCSILTNLIDNAIEACHQAGFSPNQGKISVEMRLKNKSLFIKVTNPIGEKNKKIALELKTTKRNFFMHGYGIRIIRKIVEKYCGCVQYDVKEGIFIADVVVFLPHDMEENVK